MNDLISVIIPCFNDADYIEQAVNSVIHQTHKNIEVIVVDDGSDRKTKKVLTKIEPKITKLIVQENKGQSTARNNGIKQAKGKYILVLDSDDYFEPTFCEKALSYFKNNEDVKIVSCYIKILSEIVDSKKMKFNGGSVKNFLFKTESIGNAMFKKVEWEAIGGYDECMREGYEDWEFFIRLLKKGGYAHIIKEYLFNYRKRNESTTTRALKNRHNLLKYIFLKHKDIYYEYYDNVINILVLEVSKKDDIINEMKMSNSWRIGNFLIRPFSIFKKN